MRSFLLLALSVVASCGGSRDATGPNGAIDPTTAAPGNYALVVPASPLVQQQGLTVEMTGGTFTIASNFTYSYQIAFRLTRNGIVSNTQSGSSGTWKVIDGSAMVFSDQNGTAGINWDPRGIITGPNPQVGTVVNGFFDVTCAAIGTSGDGCSVQAQFARR